MSDPAEWLTSRLDEIESRAKAAEIDAGSPWRTARNYDGTWDVVVASSPLPGWLRPIYWLWDSEDEVHGSPAVATHVAGMDPATVLGLVAATRNLLEWHAGNHECVSEDDNCVWVTGTCDTVKELAKGWGWTEVD